MMQDNNDQPNLSRRDFVKSVSTTLGVGMAATALGAMTATSLAEDLHEANRGSRVGWARLRFPLANQRYRNWGAHPTGDIKLIQQIRRATNINVMRNWHVADIDQLDRMVDFPFIFMHDQEAVALTNKQKDNLKEYMQRGGFLFIDDCVLDHYNRPDLFYQSMKKEMTQALPGARWEPLKRDHEVFHIIYDLPNGLPHVQGINHGLTAIHDKHGRMVAMIASSDLHCGWVNVGWFNPAVERDSLKMGVNIYAYAISH